MSLIKKIAKWTGFTLGGLAVLLLLGYGYLYWSTEKRFSTIYPVETLPLHIEEDSAALARGEHIMMSRGCRDCHGNDLEGKLFIDDPALGKVTAPNLTKGKNGLPQDYGASDWLRVLKHGVDREGKPLFIMPSHETAKLSDNDLADLIAYCQNRQPIDNESPRQRQLGPVARLLMVAGKLDLSAEKIDHTPKSVAGIEPAVSAEYGAYLAVPCTGCHRENFQGGEPLAPGFPPVPNITSTGRPGQWTEEQFISALRTGITPDGRQLKNQDMPWQMTKEFSDLELKAIRLHLISLPEKGNLKKAEASF